MDEQLKLDVALGCTRGASIPAHEMLLAIARVRA
jgi:hypothetical protein